MLHAAQALVKLRLGVASSDPARVVEDFHTHFFDTELFFDPFVKGKFAQDFFNAWENRNVKRTVDTAHQLVEEAQLFIEASYSTHTRMTATPAKVTA
jgi:sulfite reductase (ferredoxin)